VHTLAFILEANFIFHQLQELEAEVAQIWLNVRISLCHLLLVDQQDLYMEDFCSFLYQLFYKILIFWPTRRHFSIIHIIFGF
jgi:hypothetical protein